MTKQKKQSHAPVLVEVVIKSLKIQKDGFYIDGTFGRGGHSKEILKILGENGFLIGLALPFALGLNLFITRDFPT